ncbi:uncharacterized protein LOC142230503 [Haematobia irritans]|uniref:uncharacterized protein LOC142230503 n=1 Tax=Haematobia irritans TaxID=7368 RepID=UPI003F4FCC1A
MNNHLAKSSHKHCLVVSTNTWILAAHIHLDLALRLFVVLVFTVSYESKYSITLTSNEQTSVYFVRQLNFCLSGVTRPCEDTKSKHTTDSKYTRFEKITERNVLLFN